LIQTFEILEIAAAKKLEDELEKQRLQQAKKEQKALRRQELEAQRAVTQTRHKENEEKELAPSKFLYLTCNYYHTSLLKLKWMNISIA